MNIKAHRIKRVAAGTLLSGGTALAALGLATGTAHAFTYPKSVCNYHACSYIWCPDMPIPQPSGGTPDWDMHACHHFMIGIMSPNSQPWVSNGGANRQVAPMLIEGDPGP